MKVHRFTLIALYSLLGLIVFSFVGSQIRYIGLLILILAMPYYIKHVEHTIILFAVLVIVPYKVKISESVFLNPTLLLLVFVIVGLYLQSCTYDWNRSGESPMEFRLVMQALLLLFVVYVISFVISVIRYHSIDLIGLMKIMKHFLYFGVALAGIYVGRLMTLNDYKKYTAVLYTVLFGYTIFALLKSAYLILFGDLGRFAYFRRTMGTFGQYVDESGTNVIAGAGGSSGFVYALLLILSVLFILYNGARIRYVVGILISGMALIGMASRAAIIGILLGLTVVFLTELDWAKRVKAALVVISMAIGAIAIFQSYFAAFFADFTYKLLHTIYVSGDKLSFEPSAMGRIQYWRAIYQEILMKPAGLLIGSGPTEQYIRQYAGMRIVPHSLLWGELAKNGMFGLIALGIVWVFIFRLLAHLKRAHKLFLSQDIALRVVTVSLHAFWIGFAFNNLVSGSEFFSERVNGIIWSLTGITSGVISQHTGKYRDDSRMRMC